MVTPDFHAKKGKKKEEVRIYNKDLWIYSGKNAYAALLINQQIRTNFL
jgi:hypothetical protein